MIKTFCDKCGCEIEHANHISINPYGIDIPVGDGIGKKIFQEPHGSFDLCDKCVEEIISSMRLKK